MGGLQIEATTKGNSTVKSTGVFKWEVQGVFGVTCFYGVTEGTTLGELKEGNPAVLVVNAAITKLEGGFLCPNTTKWTAEYTLTEPSNTTMYVVSP